MDARSVALVQQSFEKVVALGDEVAKIFYVELFAIDPSLRAMFKGDMDEQHRKVLSTLTVVIRSLHTPEKILDAARKLAVKHLSYGVKAEHYTLVGNALLRTLKKGLGDAFTPELYNAWVEAFRTLADIMKAKRTGIPRRLSCLVAYSALLYAKFASDAHALRRRHLRRLHAVGSFSEQSALRKNACDKTAGATSA